MPRVGQNPARWAGRLADPAPVCGATIVHIPEAVGYWAGSPEVLELSLESFFRTAPGVKLHVFDNASDPRVRDYLLRLHSEGRIERLILSRTNVGKVGAWNSLFCGSTEDHVAYFDSDVMFLNGWLEESLRVASAFPEAGMVTAQPIAGGDMRNHWTAELALRSPGTMVDQGLLIPDAFLRAHLAGLGAPPGDYERRQEDRCDVRARRGGVSAYATASHFQFLAPRKVLWQLFPCAPIRLLGDDLQFDVEMKDLGAWRLSTTQYLVHHLGNRPPDLANELPAGAGLAARAAGTPAYRGRRQTSSLLSRLAAREGPRRLLKAIAAWTHRALAAGNR